VNNGRKLLIGAVLAVIVALVATYVLYQKIQHGKSDAPRVSQQWHYVAVRKDVAAGEKLTSDNLTTITWTSSMPIEGAFEDMNRAMGRLVSYPISSGMVVTEKYMAAPDSALGLPQKIPTGMRAIAIRADEVDDFGGFLFPDSRVDVLMTSKDGSSQHSSVVVEDVVVLATGKQMIADPTGKPTNESVVTLLVDPEQARRIALAGQLGVVHLALRNNNDRVLEGSKTTYLSDLPGEKPKPSPALAKVPVFHEEPQERVEIVNGLKSSVQAFRHNLPVSPSVNPVLGGLPK
jgi:pilus assembly protein CpaB